MLAHYIEIKMEKKRKYAYLTMRNFGYDYEEADDPWDMPHASPDMSVYVATYRFLLTDLALFESKVKAYYAKKKSNIPWTTPEETIKQALTYSHMPTKAIEELFVMASVGFKKVFAGSVDYYELTE